MQLASSRDPCVCFRPPPRRRLKGGTRVMWIDKYLSSGGAAQWPVRTAPCSTMWREGFADDVPGMVGWSRATEPTGRHSNHSNEREPGVIARSLVVI